MITPDRPRIRWVAAVAALIWLWLPAAATAGRSHPDLRQHYALIYGTVWAADGRAVYGAKVKISRAGRKNAEWELDSDHSGEFAQRVPPGPADYVVWVEGRRHTRAAELKLHIESEERQDIGLHLKE